MTSSVVAAGLAIAYGGRVAVRPSDFRLPRGGVIAVIGPNGSGKSTLLGALAGLIEPSAGRLEVLGGRPQDVRRQVAYVLQSTRVNELMPVTAREVVGMGRYAVRGSFGRFRLADRKAIAAALAQLAIADIAERHLNELSGGQRQRVFVAQGLAQEADLLLLDEPITGLDFVSREAIRSAITAEAGRGVTVVVTTHELSEASEADVVLLMAGRVVAQGPPTEVLTPDLLAEAYGLRVLHVADGRVVLDDPHHRPAGVHFHSPFDVAPRPPAVDRSKDGRGLPGAAGDQPSG